MEQLTLRWHGHACFTLTCQDFTVVFDPYEDNYVPGFPPLHLSADLVLCSHQHNDHNAAGIVSLRTGHDNPFRITEIPTFHDPEDVNGLDKFMESYTKCLAVERSAVDNL